MGATYLMSYPGPRWQIRGGANARSHARAATNPRAALKEWLTVADLITRAGGHILVMAPPEDDAQLTGLVYAADAGAMFKNGDEFVFLLSKMAVAHRQAERAWLKQFFATAGVPAREAQHAWEGQSEVTPLKSGRYLLSWGARTEKASIEEVRAFLPRGARSLDVQVKEPWIHGDGCMNALVNRAGDMHLLVWGGALANRTVPELRSFAGNYAEVLSLEEDDAQVDACQALAVNGTLLLPEGTSTGLRGALIKRGYFVEELALPELLGKGGGGPRALVNEMPGFVVSDEAPTYSLLRDRLYGLVDKYPESVAPAPPSP